MLLERKAAIQANGTISKLQFLRNFRDRKSIYLKTAPEETLQDGDREAFLLAPRNVAEAQAETPGVADQSEIAGERLPGKPTIDETPTAVTLLSVLDTVGLTLEFKSA
jgi:DNA-binding phage protein